MPLGIWAGPNGDQSCFGPNSLQTRLARQQAAERARKKTPDRSKANDVPKTGKPTTAGGLATVKLPGSHPLARAGSAIGQQWLDEQISTGSVGVATGRIARSKTPSADQLKGLAIEMLRRGYADRQEVELPASSKIAATEGRSLDAAVVDGAKIVRDGFAYSPNAENLAPLQKEVAKLVRLLGKPGDVKAVTARVKTHDETVDGNIAFSACLFANVKTGEFLELFVREGTM